MNDKYFNIVIVPQNTFRVFKLKLYNWFWISILIILSIFFIASFSLYAYLFVQRDTYVEYESYKEKIVDQKIELKKTENLLDYHDLQLNKFEAFDRKFRIISSSEDNEKRWLVGFENFYEQKVGNIREENYISERIKQISQKLQLRKVSFYNLESIILGNRHRLARIPILNPLPKGYVTSVFGMRIDPFLGTPQFHRGLDMAYRLYAPIYAPADGVVDKIIRDEGGYGLLLTINHGYGFKTRYAHLSKVEVKLGDTIKRKQKIARVGNSGRRTTGPHLHYEIILDNKFKNPQDYIFELY